MTVDADRVVMDLLEEQLGDDRRDVDAFLDGDDHTPPPEQADEVVHTRLMRAQAAAEQTERLRARRTAQRALDAEDAASSLAALPIPVCLADALAAPDEPTRYRLDGLLPAGGNATLNAIRKSGKTTTVLNLVRSLVDGVPFLDAHDVEPVTGRVTLLNYELTDRQQTAWLRDLDAANPRQVELLNLRGHRVPLLTDSGAEWLAKTLRAIDTEVAIIDPAGRAFVSAGGTNENDNTEVLRFLARLDEIKTAAGVAELVLPLHGHRGAQAGSERSRGASAWEDWPDAVWRLARDEDDRRYFSAFGRDVDTPERRLAFDPATRRLTVDGGSRRTEEIAPARRAVLDVVEQQGEVGISKNALEQMLDGHGRNKVRDAVAALVDSGQLEQRAGARNAKVLHLATSPLIGEVATGEVTP